MKKIASIGVAVLYGMTTNVSCYAETKDKVSGAQYPKVVRENNIGSIPSERSASILDLTYSPDGKYLAIVFGEVSKGNSLVIWDIGRDKIQSKIPDLDTFIYGTPTSPILWNAKYNYVTFGAASEKYPMRLYDPMTGNLIKEVPIKADNASFSDDGKKLISITGGFLHQSITIYDTDSWTKKEYLVGAYDAHMICFVADDKILVGGMWPRKSLGQDIDGIRPNIMDAILRIIDPVTGNGGYPTIIPSVQSTTGIAGVAQSVWFDRRCTVSRDGSKVTFGGGVIVDATTLEITKYGTDEEIRHLQLPFSASALSPDGKYIYLLHIHTRKTEDSLVIDSSTGKAITHFDAHGDNMVISPDGHHLAVANGSKLVIYSISLGDKP